MSVYIVASGNPIDGFTHYGPFDSEEEAIEWADKDCDTDWWVVELENPNE